MTLAVFFPSLMGVGILVSGALLISDSIRRLFPQGSLRRKHNVVVGTYGAVADAVDAAGYHLEEPWFLGRGLRERSTYLASSAVLWLAGVGSMWAGIEFYRDPLGLFYRSPWAVGIGYGFGAALMVLASLCLFVGITYQATPRPVMKLITETSLGRIILPTEQDHEAALNHVEKEQ
jgi:hypothetical protein